MDRHFINGIGKKMGKGLRGFKKYKDMRMHSVWRPVWTPYQMELSA